MFWILAGFPRIFAKMVRIRRKGYHFLARRSRNPPPNWFGPVLFSSYDYMGWVRIIILQIMVRFWCDIWLRTNVLNFGRFSPNIWVLVSKMAQIWRKGYHFLARRSRNPPPNWFGSVLFSSYDYMGWVRTIILPTMVRFCYGILLGTIVPNFWRFFLN